MKVQLGSVSTGTLRTEDLIDAFGATLLEISTDDDDLDWTQLLADAAAWLESDEDERDDEEGSEIVSDLIDALNLYAPPCCYFGTLEGDGADFGFFFSPDAFRAARHDGEIVTVSDLSELDHAGPMDDSPNHVAVVNDHGNVTLYAVTYQETGGTFTLTEIYSIV